MEAALRVQRSSGDGGGSVGAGVNVSVGVGVSGVGDFRAFLAVRAVLCGGSGLGLFYEGPYPASSWLRAEIALHVERALLALLPLPNLSPREFKVFVTKNAVVIVKGFNRDPLCSTTLMGEKGILAHS